MMRRVEEEATRMGLLVEDLLLLARLDQQRPLEQQPVDLLVIAADAVHDARARNRTDRSSWRSPPTPRRWSSATRRGYGRCSATW